MGHVTNLLKQGLSFHSHGLLTESPCTPVQQFRSGLKVRTMSDGQRCSPHSVLGLPTQRPLRSDPGRVQWLHPMDR